VETFGPQLAGAGNSSAVLNMRENDAPIVGGKVWLLSFSDVRFGLQNAKGEQGMTKGKKNYDSSGVRRKTCIGLGGKGSGLLDSNNKKKRE